ncbi:ubiquinol oxidase subunit II [Candidatus Nomurabacteria bacterium]|nr:ubiquinol oxidase subunit II [Candidatus Saccharibacteria bacterium]MCB9839715.1 ubiquinol oxidase subunit II [Candidatus Nomurabacteria bacterium]
MRLKYKVLVGLGIFITLVGLVAIASKNASFDVLSPAGEIASRQKDLIVFTTALSLIVIVPVFWLLAVFAYKYRASNKKAKYQPELDGNPKLEFIWWAIPIVIIGVLSVVAFKTSHSLDPYKPLSSDKKPLTVQVVALDWKWLFIYPEQKVASLNELNIPANTPINFQITADAPMNSFWIPKLGGQIYAMAGMQTKLHLEAAKEGEYYGSSANLSGKGFAGMNFKTIATSEDNFQAWVLKSQRLGLPLDTQTYQQLAEPSENNPVTIYSLKQPSLYNDIIMSYMAPEHKSNNKNVPEKMNHMGGMN